MKSALNQTTVRDAAQFREAQKEFHARGLRSKARYEATGVSLSADQVIDRLKAKTQKRREQVLGKGL